MAKDEVPAISEETKEELEKQVKKGKARKFFLICKGSSIKTLGVFKKGAFGPKIMQAKKDGFKGDVTYGVISGSGKSLFLNLPANDAVATAMKVDAVCDKPPVKEAKLREFLKENDLAYKPSFHLITSVSDVADPEDESDTPVPPPPQGSYVEDDDAVSGPSDASDIPVAPPLPGAPPSAIPDAPPAPGQDALNFAQLLKKIKPDLDTVVKAAVSVSQDAKLRASEAGVFARKGDFGQALPLLQQAEQLIQQGLREISGGGNTANDEAAKFRDRLQQLIPQIKAAAGTPGGDNAKLKASEANVFARKADFVQANALLDEVAQLLAGSASGAVTEAQFTARLKGMLPQVKAQAGTPGGDDAKLKVSEAAVFARKQDFVQASLLLDQAEKLLGSTIPPAPPLPTSSATAESATTDQASATNPLAKWQSARAKAIAELKSVAKDIADERHADSSGAIIELKAVIANLTAEPTQDRQIDELERYLEQDEVVIDVCELAYDIRPSLLEALAELRPSLA